MKRVITLLMAAVMLIGTAGLASAAVEFKASGHMHIAFGLKDNAVTQKDGAITAGFNKDTDEDNFFAAQRFRPKLTMKANGVTAVFEAQQHQKYWGKDWATGNPNADVRVRNAYLDFKLPGTPVKLKMGFQQLNLPSIWGHPVFENRVGAVMASVPVNDQISVAAFWARPADDNAGNKAHNSTDMFGLLVPLNFGTVKATPYFVYAKIGANDGTPAVAAKPGNAGTAAIPPTKSWNDSLIVAGANINVAPMDALSVQFDAILTNQKYDGPGSSKGKENGTGFMLATAIDYKMPFGTPGFFAWYATGNDKDNEGRLTSVATDGFGPTSLGYEGYNTFDEGAWIGTSGSGSMGIGAQIADMSFIDSLKHTIRVAYIMGTAEDKDTTKVGYDQLSEEWSFIEVNFDSNWAIYENLSAVVELGAILPSLDKRYTNYTAPKTKAEEDMAWRAQVTFRFSF